MNNDNVEIVLHPSESNNQKKEKKKKKKNHPTNNVEIAWNYNIL